METITAETLESREDSMNMELKKIEREKKLKTLELKIRMRRFQKLKEEIAKVKSFLLKDIDHMIESGEELSEELQQIKNELMSYSQ